MKTFPFTTGWAIDNAAMLVHTSNALSDKTDNPILPPPPVDASLAELSSKQPGGGGALLLKIAGGYAIIDAEDYPNVSRFRWGLLKTGYVVCRATATEKTTMIYLHRHLLGVSDHRLVDHINHNPIDNRKCNLRVCSNAQNMGNSRKQKAKPDRILSSEFKGVSFRTDRHRWQAYIGGAPNNRKSLGCYATEEEAALAYNRAAIERYGEYAHLNEVRPNGDV